MSDTEHLRIDIDRALYRAFKQECAKMGVKMSAVLRQLVENWLPEDWRERYSLNRLSAEQGKYSTQDKKEQ